VIAGTLCDDADRGPLDIRVELRRSENAGHLYPVGADRGAHLLTGDAVTGLHEPGRGALQIRGALEGADDCGEILRAADVAHVERQLVVKEFVG
jgi:hypothetical protein